jgi:hypothetical protein
VGRNDRHLESELHRAIDVKGIVCPDKYTRSRNILGATDAPVASANLPVAHRQVKRKTGSPHSM